jgi:O-antigen ligase
MYMAQRGKLVAAQSFLEKTVRWGITAIFTLLPLLYFPGRSASYVTSKEYFFIGIVDILAVLWVWLLLSDRRYRLSAKNFIWLIPLGLFLISLTISAIVGIDPVTSFFSTVESGTGLVLLYHVFLFACMVTSFVRVHGKKMLVAISQANLFASAVLAVATFYTGPNGLIDIHSEMLDKSSGGAMMGNALLVGAYFIFSVFLTLWLIVKESVLWKKILYWIGIVLMMFSPIYFDVKKIAIGEARIAAVSLIIGLFVSLFLWLILQKGRRVLRVVGAVGLTLGIIIFALAIKMIATPTTTLHQFFIAQSGNRPIDWQEAIQGIKAKPVLGWGPENFHAVFQQYLNPIVFSPGHGNEVWALHPHNNTLEVLINGGMIGFIFYLAVLVSIVLGLIRLYRNKTFDAATVSLFTGMLIAFFLQQQMIYDSIVSYVMFFTVIAIIAGFSETTDDRKAPSSLNGSAAYIMAVGIVIVLFPVWLYTAYLPAQKVDELQQVASSHSDVRIGMYQHLFHSPGSYAIDTDIEFYTDPLFFSYDPQKQILRENPTYQKIASRELASLLRAVAPIWLTRTYDYHLSLNLVELENLQYYLTGDVAQLANAEIYAKRAFALSPTDPQIYFAYAQTLVYENNISEAKVMLDKAIALNANYQPATDFRKMLH